MVRAMKRLTITVEDESLYKAMAEEAEFTNCTVEEIVIRALQFWKAETELDEEEIRELEEARKEWQEKGGMDAKEFFDSLRKEESEAGL